MAKLDLTQTTGFRFLVVILLVLGIFFRFVNLDRKVYWHDETYTSLRIAGYTKAEFVRQVFDGRVIDIEELQQYQRPNAKKGLIDTVTSLARDEPQHPPLYYVTARLWVQVFGNSVAAIRSLSALISLLVFPCVYWLCWELFESSLVGWVAIALFSVSPFHVLYAQEARPYSLWTVTILLSSAALLRARRKPTNVNWGIYAATLALSFYSFLFSGFVAISHGIYIAVTERFRPSKRLINYILAAIAGFLAFTPWLFVIIINLYSVDDATNWTGKPMPLFSLIRIWVGNLSRLFFDVNFDSGAPFIYLIIPTLLSLVLILYSLYFLKHQTSPSIWLFILLLIGVTALALIAPDLILGGRRSSVSRYLIPCYIGIQLAVAYLFAQKISDRYNKASIFPQKIWQVIWIAVITCGIVSNVAIAGAESWWMKKYSHNHPQAARIINQAPQPLFVSSDYHFNVGEILSFSYLLDPKTKLQLVTEPTIPKIPEGFSGIFVFNPSPNLRQGITQEQNYKLQAVSPKELRLAKLIKQ